MQPFDVSLGISPPKQIDPIAHQDKETQNKIYRLIAETFIARIGAKETAKAYELTKTSDPVLQKKINRSKIIAESENVQKIHLTDKNKEKLIRKLVRKLKKIEVSERPEEKSFKLTDPYLAKPIADVFKRLNIKWADYHFPESYKISLWKHNGELAITETIGESQINKINVKPSP